MKLIVGLGNIGNEYDKTNHNAGFMVLDAVAESLGFSFNKRGCDSDYSEYKTFDEKFIFAKPRTYMNSSGKAVKSLMKKFDIDVQDVLVIVDDIDLKPGEVRLRKSGSAGTHNGLKSIIAEIGSGEFLRVRVGIGTKNEGQDLADFVLSKMKMTPAQKEGLEKAASAVIEYTKLVKFDDLMAKYNGNASGNGTHK